MPYSTATPQSSGIASSLSTLDIAWSDSFQERTSERDTDLPVRCMNSARITSSILRVKTSLRNRALSF